MLLDSVRDFKKSLKEDKKDSETDKKVRKRLWSKALNRYQKNRFNSIITIIDNHQIEFQFIDKIRYIELSDHIELSDYIELSDFIELSDKSIFTGFFFFIIDIIE